ncbi:MAG: formate--tetrahydrofolate ligase [Ktedonobacteraceae bacterium]
MKQIVHSTRAVPRSNLTAAREAVLKPITEVAADMGLLPDELELYGKYKAKVPLDVLKRLAGHPQGKYIDVTAITPTPLGEGKSLTTIGLGMALNRIGKARGKRAISTVRQPSMGPIFGIKGGAAGGGRSQIVPMEEFNLHMTGDIHSVSLAHNLLAAVIDTHIAQGNKLDLDAVNISWPRVVDINDRALRKIIVGMGGKANGYPRETRFDIAVASEVMAILGLAEDIFDMRRRLGRLVIGYTRSGVPVTANDLEVAGAMAIILKDAMKPTLMQTSEQTPVLVHTGPFANIAHGNSSIVADRIGLLAADYVVTESGFGADMGMEKFMDIKCRYSGLVPNAVVMVCTVRALKMHSGRFQVVAGKPLDPALYERNPKAVAEGAVNLVKQIENAKTFGVPVVVAINRFTNDHDEDIEVIKRIAIETGAEGAYTSELWAQGSEGGVELAEAVMAACEKESHFQHLYSLDAPIKEKIATIAHQMYGAASVSYTPAAEKQVTQYTRLGYDNLPICMAKTQLSLSHNPALKGRPEGFELPIQEVRAYTGAGFLCPIAGEMMTMPGMPSQGSIAEMDIDEEGEIVGLF